VNKVRENLHISMTMNPIGEEFRTRMRNFPSIINCSAIDWFHAWPEEALLEVAKDKFEGLKLELGGKDQEDEYIKKLIKLCPYVHTCVKNICGRFEKSTKRVVHITPKS